MDTSDVDILVVGAGPAGCAAGIEAARGGAQVCVIDRAHFPRPKPCGDALSDRAVEVINELGCGDQLTQLPHAILRGSSATFPDGTSLRRDRCPGLIIGRYDLDYLLCKALENAGAMLVQGVNVRRLILDGKRICGVEGDGWIKRARYVIAADGPGSVAWRAMKKASPHPKKLAIATTAYYRDMPPERYPGDAEIYFEHDLPLGYGWIFPPIQGLVNVGVGLRVDHYKREGVPLKELLKRFEKRHPERFEGARIESGPFTWSLPLATAGTPIAAPGLLACGDAARFVDPFNGEGIWQALESGRMAGRIAAKSISNDGIDRTALRQYRKHCSQVIRRPSLIRGNLRRALEVLLWSRLYRTSIVRGMLNLAWT